MNVLDTGALESIDSREPRSVLFEIATMQPGCLADADVVTHGRSLMLSQSEEHRPDIEAPPVPIRSCR